MKKTLLVIAAAIALFFPSCEIWEDRHLCPSILAVDCSLLEGKALWADIWIFSSEGNLVHKTRVTEHDFYRPVEFEVEKGEYRCCVWANIGQSTVATDQNSRNSILYKKPGVNADQLYSFSTVKVCQQEREVVAVKPRKMFIDIYVTVKGLFAGESASLDLESDFGGYALDGKAVRQKVTISSTTDGKLLMRMLRPELPEGVGIDVIFSFKNGETLESHFDLGGYLESSGYDLSSDDLKDIMLTIDVSRLKAGITSDPFEKMPPVVVRF